MDGENQALDLVVVVCICRGFEPFDAGGISEMEPRVLDNYYYLSNKRQ